MSAVYNATLTPGKMELLGKLLGVDADELTKVASYRFDDPEGEVGVEVHLLRVPTGETVQIPLSYRGAPLEGAEAFLVGTTEHSVLGTRWVYDAAGDPVFAGELERTIVEADSAAEQFRVSEGSSEQERITSGLAEVHGTGALENADDDSIALVLAEELDLDGVDAADALIPGLLLGIWEGQEKPVVLAQLEVSGADEGPQEAASEGE